MRDNLSSCTSSTLWSCMLVLGLLSLCSFALLFQQRGTLCHVQSTVMFFSFIVCGSFSFVSHFETRWCYIKDPQSFTSRTRWFHINYAVHSCLEHGCGLLKNTHAFSKFSQCEYCYLKLPKRCKQLENLSAQIWTYFPCFGCKSRTTF